MSPAFSLTHDQSNAMLDKLKQHAGAATDAALARYLDVAPPVLSKIRHHKQVVGNALLVNVLIRTGLTFAELARWWA